MNGFERIAVCAAISLVAHVGLEKVLELLPRLSAAAEPAVIHVSVVEPPPPPPIVAPEPPPEPPKPTPPPPEPPKPAPIAKPQPVARPSAEPPKPTTDPEPPSPVKHADDDSDEPVFGVDMSSVSSAGGGPGMTVGHGHGGGGGGGPGSAAPVAKPAVSGTGDAPIGANEATKMPLPQGRCYGKYTPEATAAGTEGTVVLDLTVDENGHARDIVATEKLGNGLTESAIAALRACTFSPGEKDGHPSAVRIRGFKIRFVLQENGP